MQALFPTWGWIPPRTLQSEWGQEVMPIPNYHPQRLQSGGGKPQGLGTRLGAQPGLLLNPSRRSRS